MHEILRAVRDELKNNIDEATRQSFQRFFKEEAKCYGVKTATVNKIARKHWQEAKKLDKQGLFDFTRAGISYKLAIQRKNNDAIVSRVSDIYVVTIGG